MPALPPGQALNRLASVPVVRLAMEPTADRSDEREGRIFTAVDHKPPQWSRPWNGRMTTGPQPTTHEPPSPQWSRPWNGRMTVQAAVAAAVLEPAAMEPTVERSDDGSTSRSSGGPSEAAMEPTVERSDDRTGCRRCRRPRAGRNGA